MEDIFRRRSITALGKKLEAAVEAASSKAPAADVRKRVQEVLEALAAADRAGPKPADSALAVRAKIVADLIDRAASQYKVSRNDKTFEAYLDGLGFVLAAQKEAAKVMPELRKKDNKAASAVNEALKLAAKAFPGTPRPKSVKVPVGKFLAAASAVNFAVTTLE